MERTPRIAGLVDMLYADLPEIEAARALIVTESYKSTEHLPLILRRAYAFAAIMEKIPIVIRDGELIVGSSTIAPRGCQTFPEYSHEWLEAEFGTIAARAADPFYISGDTCAALREAHIYWRGKTVSDLAAAIMSPEARAAMDSHIFTVGNYFYNGVGHICVQYDTVLSIGFEGIAAKARAALDLCRVEDADYGRRTSFLQAVLISCDAAMVYARRYAVLAAEMAAKEASPTRRAELEQISKNCQNVPARGAADFYEACQSFWFVQQLVQLESSGHSISPGRFDQYMFPYLGNCDPAFAQELLDCIWVKFNDLNKARDAASAEGFAGYGLFQNLIVGGQDEQGRDSTNPLSYMCIAASKRVFLPQPSLSIRVHNGTPHKLMLAAADLTRTGIGLPAYFNDEIIIPSMLNRGITLAEARNYCIIGCVEPQIGGRTDGWHDAAFFNMCRPLEQVFAGNLDNIDSYDKFFHAYEKAMDEQINLLVNANNAVDAAHASRAPLPFLSAMIDDCIGRGLAVQEGGAVYNFTGPQGFGVANAGDSLYTIKHLVFDEKKYTLAQIKQALAHNFGRPDSRLVGQITANAARQMANNGKTPDAEIIAEIVKQAIAQSRPSPENQRLFDNMLADIDALPKFGNDIDEVDDFARAAAYTYTRPMERHKNPRGGTFQAGLYPVSANVPLGAQTGATPDGRLAATPIADGVSPTAGKDISGPTAAANSVAKLDHTIASNGTLFNQKFHPDALAGPTGLNAFVALIRTYFDQHGMHVQFNVVDAETLIAAQRDPAKYRHLVVRVAGYSALFTSLSKSLQDDIIRRTGHGF